MCGIAIQKSADVKASALLLETTEPLWSMGGFRAPLGSFVLMNIYFCEQVAAPRTRFGVRWVLVCGIMWFRDE